MAGLAAFRIGLGAASWVAPRRLARLYGVPAEQMTPELEYMTRIFGVRAVALGVGYLASSLTTTAPAMALDIAALSAAKN